MAPFPLPGVIQMLTWRDWAALFIFGGTFVAAIVSEGVCGTYSEHCVVNWITSTPTDLEFARYHCQPEVDRGLGDPALSVGSLQFTAALPYLEFDRNRFTVLPIVGTYVGITSFLFHA